MQRAAFSSPNNKSETEAVKAAAAEEEARREAATLALHPQKQSGGDAETRWKLSCVPSTRQNAGMKVVAIGFAQLGDDDKEKESTGRMVFGNFRERKLEEDTPKKEDSGSKGDGGSSDEDVEVPPRHRKDPLKGLTGISNAARAGLATMKCHDCGLNGHKASDCPNSKLQCHTCGGKEHKTTNCPNFKKKRRNESGGDFLSRKARKM